jgi:hypothetical protein
MSTPSEVSTLPLAQFFEFAAPFSEKFGTGNLQQDLTVTLLSSTLALLFVTVLLSIRLLSRPAHVPEQPTDEEVQAGSLQFKQFRNEVLTAFERLKGETGHLKQEISEMRTKLDSIGTVPLAAMQKESASPYRNFPRQIRPICDS